MGPIVSIIIPVYNVALFIRESLDSVINQTYKDLEILVIDDGSTDLSGAVCDEYAAIDSRIIAIHQSHQGVSAARNAGLERTTGEYIAFLDPDDLYIPSYIHRMLDAMLVKNCDMVICRYQGFDAKKPSESRGEVLPEIEGGEYDRTQALDALIEGRINIHLWNRFYKRTLWDGVRFPVELSSSEDHEVSYQVFTKCNSICVINEVLIFYRQRSGSITNTFSIKRKMDDVMGWSRVEDFLKLHSPEIFSGEQIKRYQNNRINNMISYYVKSRDKCFSGYLKKQIAELVDKIGIKNCTHKTKVKYYMMLLCPWILKCALPVYRKFKI